MEKLENNHPSFLVQGLDMSLMIVFFFRACCFENTATSQREQTENKHV